MPKQVSLHIVFRKIREGWSGTYESLDEQNKVIEIDPYRGNKKRFATPFHEFTHWVIDYYKDKFNWQKGWPKNVGQDEKEDIICYEIDEEVWEVIKKYLKKRAR